MSWTTRGFGMLMSAAVVVLATAAPVSAWHHPAPADRWQDIVTMNGTMTIIDDEWWADDEIDTFSFGGYRPFAVGDPAIRLTTVERCVGDEVRVWFGPEIHERTETGWIKVYLNAELYEGTSCSTGDRDGHADGYLWVAPGQTRTFTLDVHNEDEGGDRAHIAGEVTNYWTPTSSPIDLDWLGELPANPWTPWIPTPPSPQFGG